MSDHQHDPNANELWTYFQNVIQWVRLTFPTYRKEMKGVNWAVLYDRYGSDVHDTDELEAKVYALMIDDDVTKKSGIYPYVLTGEEKQSLGLGGLSVLTPPPQGWPVPIRDR